jgi:hypothetical protein
LFFSYLQALIFVYIVNGFRLRRNRKNEGQRAILKK